MNPRTVQPSPWVLAGEPTSLGDPAGLVTFVDGQTFCLSGRSGDFSTNPTHGVFFADMRVLSQARLLVGGVAVEPLAVSLVDASSATFVGRSVPAGQAERAPARGPPSPARLGVARADRAAQHGAARPSRRSSSWRSPPTSPTCSRSRKGAPSVEGEHSLAVGDAQPAVRLAARRRPSAGRADRRRRAGAGLDARLRVERHHRSPRSVHAAARSHRCTRQRVDRAATPPPEPAERTEPQRRLAVVGAEAAHGRPEAERGVRPGDRRHRRVASARPDRSPAAGDRRRCAVVHDVVRPRCVDQRLHGPADRPDVGDRCARGARRAAGTRDRSGVGGGARPDHARDPLPRGSTRRH